MLFLALFGCRADAPAPVPQAAATVVVDDLGRSVRVPQAPQRVVSLAPSNTELVFALGAEARLVGRTDACDFPAEAARVPSVGTLFPPDLERILIKRPDLVLMIDGLASLRTQLESRGVPVLVLQPRNAEGVLGDVRLLGQVLDLQPAAATLEARLRAELAAIPVAPERTVFQEVWPEPLTAVGPGTFAADLLQRAGGRNVVEAEGWPQVSLETVVRAAPAVIIAASEASAAAIRGGQRPGLSGTPAAQAGRVYVVPNAAWLERPGPRMVLGLRWLADVLAR